MDSYKQSATTQGRPELGCDEEVDYDSDSEEGTTALAFRRREASDDEEDDHDGNSGKRRSAYYDEDVEEQGAPPQEDEGEEAEEEEEDEDEDEEYDDDNGDGDGDGGGEEVGKLDAHRAENKRGETQSKHRREDSGISADKDLGNADNSSNKGRIEEEKKDAEPFVVPTAGAFYMHDDRFRSNSVTRPRLYNARRNAGGRKLWESKDEKPWVHDRFEELKLSEDNYYRQGVRTRRGRGPQGRGQGRGKDSMHTRGRGNKEWPGEDTHQFISRRGPGRGRGLRRTKMNDYEFKGFDSIPNQVQPSTSRENKNSAMTAETPALQTTAKSQESTSKKPTTSSILNSASPPFFPTGAISHNINGVLSGVSKAIDDKVNDKDVLPIVRVVDTSRSGVDKGMGTVTRTSSNSGNLTNLGLVSTKEVDSGVHRSAAPSSTMQQQFLKTGHGSMLQQHRPIRGEAITQQQEHPPVSGVSQQPRREAPPSQSLHVQQPLPQPLQNIHRISQGHLSQGPVQSQSVPLSSIPVTDTKGTPGSALNKIGVSTTGRGTQATTVQTGRGAFVYGSGSLSNGMRSGPGVQVVQFAGQPQPGLGVPVSLPGYSSQAQFGFQNSEVTWIPILAGGSMGSNYSSSYIAMDGSSPGVYYAPQATQTSSFPVPGRELVGSKTGASGSFKPPERPESDELGQQRKRYSQMTFGEERR